MNKFDNSSKNEDPIKLIDKDGKQQLYTILS